VFAEITPFALPLWDTRDGTKLAHDRERRARIPDCAAFDPTGRYHALWSDRGNLQVFRLTEGTLVAELEQPIPRTWDERKLGFSPDGSLLVWENADGERWALAMEGPGTPHRLADTDAPWEPPARSVKPVDGLFEAGGAAIPYDDGTAIVSPDGRQFAWLRSHYQLE
jgi:hypothetical protein